MKYKLDEKFGESNQKAKMTQKLSGDVGLKGVLFGYSIFPSILISDSIYDSIAITAPSASMKRAEQSV